MEIKTLCDDISVSPQIAVNDIATLQAKGFKTLMANRPDGESADQPSMDEIAAAAKAAGMEWIYLPVVSGQISDGNVNDFRAAFDQAPKPIMAFCRTGTRCTILWALSHAGEAPCGDLIEKAAQAGYDISAQKARMDALASQ